MVISEGCSRWLLTAFEKLAQYLNRAEGRAFVLFGKALRLRFGMFPRCVRCCAAGKRNETANDGERDEITLSRLAHPGIVERRLMESIHGYGTGKYGLALGEAPR